MNTYWEGEGKYQDRMNELAELVPGAGDAETQAGEYIRAASRITYEFYNNGFGNNVSGALNYISNIVDDDVYCTLIDYTRGVMYNGEYGDDAVHNAVVAVMDQVIEYIDSKPSLLDEPRVGNIFEEEDLHLHLYRSGSRAVWDYNEEGAA